LSNAEVVNEYSKRKQSQMMNKLLQQGLSQTKAVLALWTERYGLASPPGKQNWTKNEWHSHSDVARIAMVAGEFKPKPMMTSPDQVISIAEIPDPAEAARAAKTFKRMFESVNTSSSG
jgi:hypothetical protein